MTTNKLLGMYYYLFLILCLILLTLKHNYTLHTCILKVKFIIYLETNFVHL